MKDDVTLWRVELDLANTEEAEAFTSAFDEFAASSAWFSDGDADDPLVRWKVEAHFKEPPDHARIEAAIALIAASRNREAPTPVYDRLPSKDWVTANLASFPPVDAGRFHIRGSHIKTPKPTGRITLTIDAGTAFGSGEHATTKGCLLALDRLMKRRKFFRPVDIGCGSGILALALSKAMGVRGIATDIDPVAVRVTLANARRNGVRDKIRAAPAVGTAHKLIRQHRPYDLIFANILARPLHAMAANISAELAPGGVAILAGLLTRQERFVLAPFRSQGVTLMSRIKIGAWTILVITRPLRARPKF